MVKQKLPAVLELLLELQKLGQFFPRNRRTPTTEAATTLTNLGVWLDSYGPKLFAMHDDVDIGKAFVSELFLTSFDKAEELADDATDAILSGGTFEGLEVAKASAYCCLAAMKLDKAGRTNEAWTFAIDARHLEVLTVYSYDSATTARRALGRTNAAIKLARDPKQSAKVAVFALWQDRRAGKHPKLRTNEQFAVECMRRWPVLTSAKVILGWCTQWNKQAKRKP